MGKRFFTGILFFLLLRCLSSADDAGSVHSAVQTGDYSRMDKLIAAGADLDVPDSDGFPPLHRAVTLGDTAMVRTLVLGGAKIDGPILMAEAYRRRDNPTMNLLLNAKVDPDLKLSETGERLIDMAFADGAVDTVRILLQAGAKADDLFWKSMLSGEYAMARMLLQNGIDPRREGPDGRAALEYVLEEDLYTLVLPVLEAHSEEPSSEPWLSRAIRNGNEEITLALLKGGFPLGNQRAADHHSLLGWAIAHGMDEVALHLIKAGANVNIIERCPAHPQFVEQFSESTTFQRLLSRDYGIRPLMMVPVKKNYKLARSLKDAGAENKPTRRYHYPVSVASWYDDVKMMQILLGRDPDVQERKLVVDLSDQKVEFYENGELTYSSVCSTGKKGYRTKTGSFVITQKRKRHVSNIYGSSMPNFMRLSCGDFGFHTGYCPGYPASHGCIRLPSKAAVLYYSKCKLGDLVEIRD